MLSHDVILEARDWAFGDNRAAVHYVKTITDGETEIEVFRDEEDAEQEDNNEQRRRGCRAIARAMRASHKSSRRSRSWRPLAWTVAKTQF